MDSARGQGRHRSCLAREHVRILGGGEPHDEVVAYDPAIGHLPGLCGLDYRRSEHRLFEYPVGGQSLRVDAETVVLAEVARKQLVQFGGPRAGGVVYGRLADHNLGQCEGQRDQPHLFGAAAAHERQRHTVHSALRNGIQRPFPVRDGRDQSAYPVQQVGVRPA